MEKPQPSMVGSLLATIIIRLPKNCGTKKTIFSEQINKRQITNDNGYDKIKIETKNQNNDEQR